jgi:RND family efflux transporter MFP subunit
MAVPENLNGDAGFVGVVVSSTTVDVSSLQEGTVLKINARMGESVIAGQVLATLESTDVRQELAKARAQIVSDNADIERAVLERQQAEERQKRAVGAAEHLNIEEVSSARYAARFAVTNEKALRAHRMQDIAKEEQLRERLSQRSLRAPVDSVVAERFLDPGATVSVGTVVLRLVGQADWRVRFAIPEGDERGIRLEGGVSVQLPAGGPIWHGKITQLAPSLDPASMTRVAEALLAVPDGGPPFGAMVRVHLEGGSK